MKIYHGTNIGGIKILEPQKTLHEKPYVYFSTDIVVATLYTASAVKKPHYWLPYGFNKDGRVKYQEIYSDALKDVYNNKTGYVYECDADENLLENPTNIHCARLSASPVKVSKCIKLDNIYQRLLQYTEEGKFTLTEYKKVSEGTLKFYRKSIIDSLKKCAAGCDYTRFVKEKMPDIWNEFITLA